jgi:hypothetical protein
MPGTQSTKPYQRGQHSSCHAGYTINQTIPEGAALKLSCQVHNQPNHTKGGSTQAVMSGTQLTKPYQRGQHSSCHARYTIDQTIPEGQHSSFHVRYTIYQTIPEGAALKLACQVHNLPNHTRGGRTQAVMPGTQLIKPYQKELPSSCHAGYTINQTIPAGQHSSCHARYTINQTIPGGAALKLSCQVHN